MKRVTPAALRSALWLTLLAIGLTFVPSGAQPADSGEFQLVARDLGVAHPPGYPLYTLSAHVFGRLALAIPPLHGLGWPWAVNALSMVLAIATLAVVARTAARLGGTWLAGAVASALLAFAPTFASQALVANIRMGTGLFTALLLSSTLEVVAGGGHRSPIVGGPHPPTPSPNAEGGGGSRVGGGRSLVVLCLVGALAAGHHPTLAALALPLGLAILVRRPAALRDRQLLPRLAATCVSAALIGLLPLLYLPIRAAQHAPLAPADLATWGGVWRHVTAAGFRGDMLAITGAQELGDRLLVLANILQLQFTPLALALMAIGAAWLVARRRAEALALLGTALVVAWLAITYRAPQTMEYLLPAYVALAIIAGAGTAVLARRLRDLPLPQHWGRGSGGGGLLGRAASAGLESRSTDPTVLPRRHEAPSRRAVARLSSPAVAGEDPRIEVRYLTLRERLQQGRILSPATAGERWTRQRRGRIGGLAGGPYLTGSLAILATALFLRFGLPLRGRAPSLAVAAVPDLSAVTRLAADPNCLPGNATVLASWHFATPLWLAGRRAPNSVALVDDAPYVTAAGAPIVYVHPDFETSDPIGETWRKRLVAADLMGPVVLSNRTTELSSSHIPIAPVLGTPLWRLSSDDSGETRCPSSTLTHSAFNFQFGSAEEPWAMSDVTLQPLLNGIEINVTIEDRGPVREVPTVAFAQLLDEANNVVGQVDRPLHAPWTNKYGFPTYDLRLILTPYRGTDATRTFSIVFGLYEMGVDGVERLREYSMGYDHEEPEGRVGWHQPATREVYFDGFAVRIFRLFGSDETSADRSALSTSIGPVPDAGSIPFDNAMTLIARSVHRTPTALLVDLTWRADPLAPLSDYTISVQAAAADASWHAQHDGTPALGAIPTLKWLAGMVIHDRHRIPLPPEAAGHDGPFTVTVGVYDAFSLEPLPVTDGNLVRQGQGQRAIIYPSP